MVISERGVRLVAEFEGFSPTRYICAGGWPTIGYGHVIRAGEDFGAGITREQGAELLQRDLEQFERAVDRLTPRQLTLGQFEALASFTFNLGAAAYQRSTLRQCVLVGHDDLAAEQFGRWTRAGGMVRQGLVRRRRAEADLYLHG